MATTRTYADLVQLVRNWANRDSQALPDTIIQDSIRYSIDKAYRHLRIPPLEHTVSYTSDMLEAASIGQGNVYQSVTALAVPSDLIEFIQIRGVDQNGLTTRVFNEKSDIRSYWDLNNRHFNQSAFWSRQGDQVLLTPAFGQVAVGYYGGFNSPEVAIEMYYYRRLPALNAVFNITANNFNGQSIAGQTMTEVTPQPTGADIDTFLAIDGNGELWFEDPRTVSVEAFYAGSLTLARLPSQHSDGTLWFHGPSIDYAITPANFAAGDMIFQVDSALTSQGELWFGPERITERHVDTTGNPIIGTDRPILSPTTGQRDRTAIATVVRIRDGVEQNLTEVPTGEFGADEWQFGRAFDNGTASIHVSALAGDIFEISYHTPPTEPTGTAHDAENTGLGIITSFFFRGHTDFDLVDPTTTTEEARRDLRVSTVADDFFDTELRFEIDGTSFMPEPMINTAYDANTDPSTRERLFFTGTHVPNWFRDENERIALYGALAECFAYLQEDDQAGKYIQLMMKEIEELNEEDRVRDSSGGNVQVQYNARGLI